MPNLCLPKKARDKLLNALTEEDVTLEKLYDMTSEQRNVMFKRYVGKDFAQFVNAKFEQAMLSNQKKAFRRWIEQTTQFKEPVRRDMLKKVDRIEKFLLPDEQHGFLKDLAEMKLGIGVTEEEAKTIIQLKTQVDELRAAIPENSPIRSQERLEYGFAVDRFKTYVGDLKREADSLTPKERLQLGNTRRNVVDTAGTTKSLLASFDNSFLGRQGWKVLLAGEYRIWAKAAKESIEIIGKELFQKEPGLFKSRNDAVMSAIRADIYSRPNALNGKYKAAQNGYGLGVLHEEAFPTSIPEKIPFLGKVFKASETAFNGTALKMRSDLADAYIAVAEKNGIDMLDVAEATSAGRLIGSMTGRGEIGRAGAIGEELNVLLFSVRFLKSNMDTLTAHHFDKTMTPYARKQAAMSTLRIAGSITTMLAVADMLNPGSVEWDPRSSAFGTIKVGNHRYDVTAGMRGLVVLGMKVVPTMHNGEWGFWTKSASTGKYTKMSQGTFGEQTALNTVESFFEGKFSPATAALRDVWKGQKFSGEKPTIVNTVTGLTTPISLQILQEELKQGNDDLLFAMIAEGLGFSNTPTQFGGYGKRWDELKEKKGDKILNESLQEVTSEFNRRADKLRASPRWERMDNEEQSKELDKIKKEETDQVLKRYGI